jgi:PAS domain S-box-containing protein
MSQRDSASFFNHGPGFNCLINSRNEVIDLNDSWLRFLDYSRQDLLMEGLLGLLRPSDKLKLTEYFDALRSGIDRRAPDLKIRTNGGHSKWLRWNATFSQAQGELFISATDITDLMVSHYHAKQIAQVINQSAIVATTDLAGRIVEVNNNFCALSGYSAGELIGKTHRLVKSGEHPESFYTNIWKTIRSGQTWSGDITNRSKSGQPYTVHSVISPIFDVDGQIQKFLAVRFDVTKERRLEQHLEEAQKTANIGSWSFLKETGRIEWTRQMFALFPENEADGPPNFERHFSTIHEEDRAYWLNTVNQCLEDGKQYEMRFRSVFPDGTFKWINAIGKGHFDPSGKVRELSGTCQDITHAVEIENALRMEQARAMQNAKLAELGEISASIAHEISNPLTVIAGIAHTFDIIVADPARLEAGITSVKKAVSRISKIVTGLRKYSRNSGESFRECMLQEIVEETMVLTAAKARDHDVKIELVSNDNGKILCDDVEIGQVVINLINNGIDAVKDLSEKWVRVSVHSDQNAVSLLVHDSGRGIPPEVRDKMFQSFYTTKPVGVGTGLGLAIVKTILNRHNATINVRADEPNTCFEIKFPASSKEVMLDSMGKEAV